MADAMHIACAFRDRKTEGHFEDEVVVGRRESPDDSAVILDLSPDKAVSRRHARIWVERGKCWIEDLDSRGGTFLGSEPIKEKLELLPGVPVIVGQTMLRLVALELSRSRPHAEVRCAPVFNYSLAHCGMPFIEEMTLYNDDARPLDACELEIVLRRYGRSAPIAVPALPAGGKHTISCPHLLIERTSLRDLPTAEPVPLQVWMGVEPIPVVPSIEVTVLPPNSWNCCGHEVSLAGFVMPNIEAIDEVVGLALPELQRRLPGVQGFADALESDDPTACMATLQALYYCLQERYRINYEYEPRTYADWQAVRFHHEVLDREKPKGTCIDVALLFAACLENVHRDPLIILVETASGLQHAVIGCWRHGTRSKHSVLFDEDQLRRWVRSREILVLDSKGFPRTQEFPTGMGFNRARKEGNAYVNKYPLRYAIDIVAARYENVAPMPFGKGPQWEPAVWCVVFQARRQAENRGTSPSARQLLLGLLTHPGKLLWQALAKFGDGVPANVAAAAKKSMGVPAGDIAQSAASKTRRGNHSSPARPTQDWEAVLRRAEENARANKGSPVTEADLTTALLQTPSRVEDVLKQYGLTTAQIIEALHELIARGGTGSQWHSSGFAT